MYYSSKGRYPKVYTTMVALGLCLCQINQGDVFAATDINLSRDDSRINWPTDYPRNAEYKDVQLAPFDAQGNLMMYLPVTRPVDGKHLAAMFRWDPNVGSDGEFVDITGSGLPFQNEDSKRDTYDVDFADVDGDGDYDVVHSSPHGNFLYIKNGDTFSDESDLRFPPIIRTDLQDVWDDVVTGDVDGDGDIDLIFANRTFDLGDRPDFPDPSNWGPTILLYNNGNGFYNQAPGDISTNYDLFGVASDSPFEGELESASHSTRLGDLNNDGRMDMVISHIRNYLSRPSPAAQAVDIYLNTGTTNDGRVQWSQSSMSSTEYVMNMALFDVNNDGNLDLYLAQFGSDQIHLGNGDGTFGGGNSVNTLAGGVPAQVGTQPITHVSYDVVIGDLNDDGWQDIVAPDGDGGFRRANKIFLNDTGAGGGLALQRSNDDVINPVCNSGGCSDWDQRPFQVTAAIADVNKDEKLDIIWGSDGRVGAGDPPNEWPTVTMNTTAGLSDTTAPVIVNPAIYLEPKGEAAAVFSARISDRVQDLDEITANMQWSATGSGGSNNVGSSALSWAAVDHYQARLSCSDLRAGFAANETITGFTWQIAASDLAGNSSNFSSTDGGAPNLLAGLSDIGTSNLSLNILEPSEGSNVLVPNDGSGRLLVRVSYAPVNMIPEADQFEVVINGDVAQIVTGERVANEFWLAVVPPAGPVGAHDIQVRYRFCNQLVSSVSESNAVFYDDDVLLSDTVLVVDASGSMEDDRKIESARNAARLYANVVRDPEHIGVVSYAGSSASDVFNVNIAGDIADPGPPPIDNRMAAADAAQTINPNGCTPMGLGLLKGLDQLNSIGAGVRNVRRNLVLLSDGMENVAPYWDAVPDSTCGASPDMPPVYSTFETVNTDGNPETNVKINTVSLGPDARPDLMQAIANATDGDDLVVNVVPSPDDTSYLDSPLEVLIPVVNAQSEVTIALENALANIYEHHHNNASYQQRLWQHFHTATGGDQGTPVPAAAPAAALDVEAFNVAVGANGPRGDRVVVPIEPGLDYAVISVNWPEGRSFVGAQPPAGQDLSNVKVVRGDTNTVFQIESPQAGEWLLGMPHTKGTEIMINVSGVSSEKGFARAVTGQSYRSLENGSYLISKIPKPGSEVPIHLVLVGNTPVLGASVVARAQGLGGQSQQFTLSDNGNGIDAKPGDGIYSGLLTETDKGGVFDISIIANWIGSDSVARQRQFPLSVPLLERDSDGDSISDIDEETAGTNPSNPNDATADPDGDGIPTWRELELDLDPFNADTDGGGTNDGDELIGFTDPSDPRDDDQAGVDTDGDGMSDNCEMRFGFDNNDASDGALDKDGDGLSNAKECQIGTSPVDRDTDNDGQTDGEEVDAGTDPNDPDNRGTGVVPPGGGTPDQDCDDHCLDKNKVKLWLWLLIISFFILLLIMYWLLRRP